MSHFRRNHKHHKEGHNFAIQQDQSQFPPLQQRFQSTEQIAMTPCFSPLVKDQKMNSLISNLQRVQNQSKILQDKKKQKLTLRKSVDINMMRIRDESYTIDKNIFNITVGQIFSKEEYLSSLNKKINQYKTKIQQLEEQQGQKFNKTTKNEEPLQYRSEYEESVKSKTIDSSKPYKTGTIYFRNSTPSSQRRKVRLPIKKDEKSSYYKWRPEVDEGQVDAVQQKKQYHTIDQRKSVGSSQKKNSKSFRYTDNQVGSMPNKEEKEKQYINYRVKQKSSRPPLSSKELISSVSSASKKREVKQKFRTEELSTPKTQKTQNNPQMDLEEEQKSRINKESQNASEPQEKQEELQVQLEPYDGILFRDVSEFSIKDMTDDFRAKITQQLQVPGGFPKEQPQLGLTMDELQEIGPSSFELFGIKVKRQPNKLINRKFKNGVYYHLDQTKNILWYFSGSFYIGGWDSDLPTEGQKKGMGFEYIPDKYFYRGQFKDGVKDGKGCVKLYPSNPNNPECFMAYQGEWKRGKPHGFGKHIDQKQTKYIGNFVSGQKTGSATIISKEGIQYRGEVLKGIKHGFGTEKLTNGDSYIGKFQNGCFHGQGLYKWNNGSTYEGQFFKGKRQGRGTWKGANGDIFEGEYFNDLKNGWGKFIWINGQIYEGQFKDDIRHGQGTYKHPSGKLGKFMWKQGQIDYRIYTKEEEQYRCRNREEDGQWIQEQSKEVQQQVQ